MSNEIVTAQRALTQKDVFLKPTRQNQKKAKEELEVLALAWDYDNSVGKMQKLVYKWKNMTVEVMRGLWEAHHVLTEAGKEFRTANLKVGDEVPNGQNFPFGKTWSDYCDEIGISRRTASNWLKRFVPRELSASGEDILLTPEEYAQLEEESAEKTEAWVNKMVDQYEVTKVRGAKWNDECEKELQRRNTMRRVNDEVDAMVAAWSKKPDYRQMNLFDAWVESQAIEDIRLPSPQLTDYQFRFFRSVDDYLASLSDVDIRSQAARNLVEKIRRRMNEDLYQTRVVQSQELEEE